MARGIRTKIKRFSNRIIRSLVRPLVARPSAVCMNKKIKETAVVFVDETTAAIIRSLVAGSKSTGMTTASLDPLAQKVGHSAQLSTRHGPRPGLTTLEGRYIADRYREIREGREAGNKAYSIQYATSARLLVSFDFYIKVYQWSLWDKKWAALEQGFVVAEQYLKEHIKECFIGRFSEVSRRASRLKVS